ncbi:MAG TPA: isochorismatase family protein [Dehalococcoidales bacterium]|nr:isochorismatase family protein [Dehalococcoidales bacterium]
MQFTLEAEPEPIKLDSAKTALIVVDMQNAFCKKDGLFDAMGMLNEEKVKPVIANNKKVIAAFRRAGIKVVYLRMAYRADLSDAGGPDSPNYWKEKGRLMARKHSERQYLLEGSWDAEIIDELKPSPGDIVVAKNRFSGFFNTGLNSVLRTLDVKHIVFTGVATNVCVESTIRDAFFHEYFPVLVSDACTNTGPDFIQEATIWNVKTVFGWVTQTAALLKALK